MSDLSVFNGKVVAALSGVIDFFKGITSPSTQSQATQVVSTLQSAAQQAEAALPNLATDMANAALAFVPGGLGTAFDPVVDALIDQAIAVLASKKSTAAAS